MMCTVVGWILWIVIAVFAFACFVGGPARRDRFSGRVIGLVLALGLAATAIFPRSKLNLLWILWAAFFVESLISFASTRLALGKCETCGSIKRPYATECPACGEREERIFILKAKRHQVLGGLSISLVLAVVAAIVLLFTKGLL